MHRGFALSVAGSQSALAEEQYSESDAIALEQEERERFTKEIRKSLQSSSTKNKIDALRKILALVVREKSPKVEEYFAEVVKNLAHQNSVELRQLVYAYLSRFASAQPDVALLAVNSLQKDLMDTNPLIRAKALRCLISIELESTKQIRSLSVKKCLRDMSPFVRKTAAIGILQLNKTNNNGGEELKAYVEAMLTDRHPTVLGSVVMAFECICPNEVNMLHKHYRRLCACMHDMDEWGQVYTIRALMRYVRLNFLQPESTADGLLPRDHQLFMDSLMPLLHSHSYAVVLQSSQAILNCGPAYLHSSCVGPLLRPLRMRYSISEQLESLRLIERYLIENCGAAELFERHYSLFIPTIIMTASDETLINAKLGILTKLASQETVKQILFELFDSCCQNNCVIKVIGDFIIRFPSVKEDGIRMLLNLIQSDSKSVADAAVDVFYRLLSNNNNNNVSLILSKIGYSLPAISQATVKSRLIWLLGHNCRQLDVNDAQTFLQHLASKFDTYTFDTCKQVLFASVKIFYATQNEKNYSNVAYILESCRRSSDFTLRDYSRLLSVVLFSNNTYKSKVIVNGGAGIFNDLNIMENFLFGYRDYKSTRQIVIETNDSSSLTLPAWTDIQSDDCKRDCEDDSITVNSSSNSRRTSIITSNLNSPIRSMNSPIITSPIIERFSQSISIGQRPQLPDLETFLTED